MHFGQCICTITTGKGVVFHSEIHDRFAIVRTIFGCLMNIWYSM
jgi:hypothetical protein